MGMLYPVGGFYPDMHRQKPGQTRVCTRMGGCIWRYPKHAGDVQSGSGVSQNVSSVLGKA